MKILALGILSLSAAPAFASVRSYSCADLPRLRASVSGAVADASVAAEIIGKLAENANPCVELVSRDGRSVKVRYLDPNGVAEDAFTFSRENLLVSWTRIFSR